MFGQARIWIAAALLGLTLVLAPGVAQARWLRAESPNFIVYSDGDERVLREYVQQLETFDALLKALHRLQPDGAPNRKLPVYLVRNLDQLRVIYDRPDIAGVYVADVADVFAVAIRSRESDRTLLHEYVHHFMLRHYPYGYPAWLVEGYAEYFSTTRIGARIEVGLHDEGRADNLLYLDWIPMETVLRNRPLQIETFEGRAMFYAQSWLLTHYLMSGRREQMLAYMTAVGNGGDPVDSMQEATGMSAEQLQRELRAYLRGGLQFTRIDADYIPPQVEVTTLPASADDLLLLRQRLMRGVAEEEKAALVARVRERAARHPGDRLAELTLARAEAMYGDRAAGEAILQRRLTAEPTDVEALQLLGFSRMAAARETEDAEQARALFAEAAMQFALAYRADPNQYQTLYGLGMSRSRSSPSENDIEAMLAAHELAPQVGTIRLVAASGLMQMDRDDYAAHLLQPLAFSPHEGEGAAQARQMLEAALRRLERDEPEADDSDD